MTVDNSRLFSVLHRGGHYVCYMTLTPDGSVSYTWRKANQLGNIPRGKLSVYYSVHPLLINRGPRHHARIQDVMAVNSLFADFDAKDFDDDKAKVLDYINSLQIPPSIIIDSGGGYQPYWLLSETFLINSPDERDYIASVERAWVKFVGADQGTKDLAHVMRVPGSINYKAKYAPDYPTVNYVFQDYDRVYTLYDLVSALPYGALDSAHTEETNAYTSESQQTDMSDDDLLTLARNSSNGAKFSALMRGDWQGSGYGSQNQADLAFAMICAFWCGGDAGRIDQWFRRSGLYREKWDKAHNAAGQTYGQMTIERAKTRQHEFYTPHHNGNGNGNHNGNGHLGGNGNGNSTDGDAGDREDDRGRGRVTVDDFRDAIESLRLPDGSIIINTLKAKMREMIPQAALLSKLELLEVDELLIEAGLPARWISNWKSLVKEARRAEHREQTDSSPNFDTNLPVIIATGRQLRDVVVESYSALIDANVPPVLFVRSNRVVRVCTESNDNEQPRTKIQDIVTDSMRLNLTQCANFVTVAHSPDGDYQRSIDPPNNVTNSILAMPSFPELPSLIGISTAPVLASDMTIQDQLGYQPKTQLFYSATSQMQLTDTTPTPENIARSKDLLIGTDGMLGEFPFDSESSRANALALVILPFVRPAIRGATPMHFINAPTEGTGKTLLAKTCSLVFNPQGGLLSPLPADETEIKKVITSLLRDAPPVIIFDNITGSFNSSNICLAVTAASTGWSDRILGESNTISLPARCVWVATANNATLGRDMKRRTLLIQLDANVQFPGMRPIKRGNLEDWIIEHRNELVSAVLTIIRGWIEKGCIRSHRKMNSLESLGDYLQVIGGIMESIGITCLGDNAEQLDQRSDPEDDAWESFVESWASKYGSDSVTVSQLFNIASTPDDRDDPPGENILESQLRGNTERSRRAKLGDLLMRHVNRVYGEYKIELRGKASHTRITQYWLSKRS